jgi:hypothetical protein
MMGTYTRFLARRMAVQNGQSGLKNLWIKFRRQTKTDTAEPEPSLGYVYASEQDRIEHLARDTKGWKTNAIICASLSVAAFALPKVHWPSGDGVKQAPQQDATGARSIVDRRPNEVDTNAMCDLAVKRTLASENSFDPELGGTFYADGNIGTVTKKFDATNGFGAKLTHRYTCKWDSVKDAIVSLTVTGPTGETTRLR